jgi:hypothetical protein
MVRDSMTRHRIGKAGPSPSCSGATASPTSTSPYLQQHADNPVDWWPWCDEALALAREQDKPILLSIGYSACHWCHVMAHESFEDAATAEVMNRLFVNIKVDREERPDLDKIYQTAHQLLARRPGGWPLTVFLTPDDLRAVLRRHLFSARAAPRPAGLQRPARQHRARLPRAGRRHPRAERLADGGAGGSWSRPGDSDPGCRAAGGRPPPARRQLRCRARRLRPAPKFPHPSNLELLLRHWAATAAVPEQMNRRVAGRFGRRRPRPCTWPLHAGAHGPRRCQRPARAAASAATASMISG